MSHGAILLALIFRYFAYDNYLDDSGIVRELNREQFVKFINTHSLLLKYKSAANYLLTQTEYVPNDFGITLLDFNYFQDILFHNQPCIYLEGRYTTHHDDELLTIKTYYKGDVPKYDYTKKDIYNIIEYIGIKSSKYSTDFFKNLNTCKFNKLLNFYKKGF